MKSLKLYLVLLYLAMSTILQAQNFWGLPTQKSNKILTDTGCPTYDQTSPQVAFEWQYVIGTPDSMNLALDIEFDCDSNLVYLYKDFSQSTFFLVGMKQSGEELWRTLIITDDSIGFGLKITPLDTVFYVSGYWDIDNIRHFGITKLNNHGQKLWFKELSTTRNDSKKIREFNPNLIAVEDNHLLGTFIDKDEMFIAKMDSSGNIIWNKTMKSFGYDFHIYISYITFNQNSYYVFVNNHDTCFITNLSFQLEIINKIRISNELYNATFTDKSFIFTGYDYNNNNFVRKYNSDFSLQYEYLTYDEGTNLYDAASINTINDNSLLVFYEYEYPGFDYDIYYDFNVLHLDKNGQCKSTLYLGAAGSQYAVKMLNTKNGDCILYGYGYNSYYNQDMVALVKVKQWDPVGINDKNQTLRNMEIWPTPAHNNLQIKFSNHTVCTLKLYALTGKLLAQYRITDETTTIDISGLVPGIYIISTSDGEDKQFQRFAKN